MPDLNKQIAAILPDLDRFARHLAHDPDEAGDLVQDCVERALRKRHLYRPDTNLRAWMFTMMRNLFINRARHKRVARAYAEQAAHHARSVQPPRQTDALLLSETLRALQRLSRVEREAVVMFGIEQRSHEQVAERDRVPVGTLKSRLSRGREKLRAILDGAEGREDPTPMRGVA